MEIRYKEVQFMKFSKEKIDEIKSQIRLCLAKNPKASCREIADILGYNFKFINWVKNEVHKELSEGIAQQSIQEEIGRFELLVQETGKHLWEVIANPISEVSEKINAIKSLIANHALLLDKKINSGLINRQPVPEQKHLDIDEVEATLRRIITLKRKVREEINAAK